MSESEEGGAFVVVDPSTTSRNLAEDLEDEFDRQVIAMDSLDFDTEASQEVIDAAVYIICWDLGFRSGIDLLEEVRMHPGLKNKVVLMAMEEPKREQVNWAMSLGADGVVCLPYDPEEVRARLEPTGVLEAKDEAA